MKHEQKEIRSPNRTEAVTRTGTTKVRELPATTFTTSRGSRRVEKNKATKIHRLFPWPHSLCGGERRKIETEGRRQVKNEHSDSRCWATQSKNYWYSQHKSTTSRATRGVEQKKARKIEMETNVNNEESDSRCWAKQSKQYWRLFTIRV